MKKLLLLLCIFVVQQSFSQVEDAWVFFSDKENVAESIANPILIMTQEAIDRKELHGTIIDERDVPVNEDYIAQVKDVTGITVYAKSKWMNCVYVKGEQSIIETLLELPFVEDIEYANKSLNLFPGDPIEDKFAIEKDIPTASQRITYNYGAAANQIEMLAGDYLHELEYAGDEMIIAVLDAGFPSVNTNSGFEDMINEGRLLGTYDFQARSTNIDGTSNHGTRVASDIVGFLEDQFVGTAPQASFYFYVTEYTPTETPLEEAHWVEALERSDSLGVDVVNTSLSYKGYDDSTYTHTFEDLDGESTFAARGGNIAFDKGMILVCSAGNSGNSDSYYPGTPADAKGVLTIGAVNSNGNYSSFSSYGPTTDGRYKPDVMAQGSNAAVITTNGTISTSNGTSFSSPIMAGVVACLWQSRPEVPNDHVMQVVREAGHLYNNPTNQMGYGIPNFEDAYNLLQELGIEEEFLLSNFALYPNPVANRLNVSFPQEIANATINIHSILGEKLHTTEITPANNVVSIESLSKGIYLATITAKNKSISFKIIKE